jgi:hypothetical protein
MTLRPLKLDTNIMITLLWYYDHSIMVLEPLLNRRDNDTMTNLSNKWVMIL